MKRRSAFTLVELIVVIAIISALIAIIMPALGKAREQAKKTLCAANLAAIGKAISIYASQADDHIPYDYRPLDLADYYNLSLGASSLILDVLKSTSSSLRADGVRRVFYCPSNPQLNNDFFWNFNFVGGQWRVIGYCVMIKKIPKDGEQVKSMADATSADPIHRQKRIPPLAMYDRLQANPLGQRCDLALDAITSNRVGTGVDPKTGLGSGKIQVLDSWPIDFTNDNFTAVSAWPYLFPAPNPLPAQYLRGNPHLNKARPSGANVLSIDGHVEWRPFEPYTTLVIGAPIVDLTNPANPKPDITPKSHGRAPFFWFPYPP